MTRLFASALLLAALSGVGFVGCADKAKEETQTTTTTPTGTTTATDTHEVKSTEPAATNPVTPPEKK